MTGWRGGGIIRVELGRVVARKIEGCREVGLARRGSGAMQARYTDFRGNEVLHDGASPVSWRVSVHTIVIVEGSLLLMEPQYSEASELPGGEVLAGETLLDGARRECWEETGYSFQPIDPSPAYIGEQWYFEDEDGSFRHSLFLAWRGTVLPEPDPRWRPLAGETRRVVWLPTGGVRTAKIHPNHRRVLAALLSQP